MANRLAGLLEEPRAKPDNRLAGLVDEPVASAEPGHVLIEGENGQFFNIPAHIAEYSDRIRNSLTYSRALMLNPEAAFDLEPNLNKRLFGTRTLSKNPAILFKDAFVQSLSDKPAMMLRGLEVYTPGQAMGIDKQLDKAATFLRSLQDPEKKEQLQEVASGKLWPIGDGRRWWQVEARYLPEVINSWAVNVADQLPIMLATIAGRTAGKIIGTPIALVAGGAAALVTGGPDPSDVITAPAVVAITSEIVKHLGGAAPMIAMEAGAFMDESDALGLDRDISEKYAKGYGLASGAIEYAQWLWVLGRYSKISKAVQSSILKQVLGHIGGSLFEGVEEITQQGLQNFLMQKAVAEMKERHPDYEGEAPKITEGLKRSGQIGAGVAFITGLPGSGMSIAQGVAARRRQIKPETKKFLGEPSAEESAKVDIEGQLTQKLGGVPSISELKLQSIDKTITEADPAKRDEAVELIRNLLAEEKFSILSEEDRVEIGQRVLSQRGFEANAEELLKAPEPPATAITPEKPTITPKKPADAPAAEVKGAIRPIGKGPAQKQVFTSVPKEWTDVEVLQTRGQKGLRARGNLTIKGRKGFIWTNEFSEVPVRLPASTMAEFKKHTDEIFKVQNFKGDDYWLVPTRLLDGLKQTLPESAFVQRDKPVRTPKQQINDAINSMVRQDNLFNEEIGGVVQGLMDEFGLTEADVSPRMKTFIEAFNEQKGKTISEGVQVGVEQEVLSDEELERQAIQAEDEAGEIGDFLDGLALAQPAPAAKPKEPTTLGPDVTGILGGVPREAPGLTQAEIEHLGRREQDALRAAQKRGLKVGFKQGVAETILDARRTMAAILTKKAINEKNKMDLVSITLTYLPKDQQGRFIRRILDLKTPKAAKKLTVKIRDAAETLIERQAVRDAKGELKKQIGRIPKFGKKIKLRPAAIQKIEAALEDVDPVKLSKAKRAELEAVRNDLKEVGFEIQKQFEVPSEQELSGITEVVGEKVVRQLQRLQKESIADMSADDITAITDAVRYALDQNTKETQEKNKAKAERQEQQRKESKDEMTKSRTATEINTEKGKESISLPQRILGFFRQDSMHRWALVESATSEGVNTTSRVLDLDIHEGKVKSLDTQLEALDLLKAELDRIGWDSADVERIDDVHKITLGGKKYELTTAEIMSLGMNVLSDRNAKQIVRTKSLWIAGREVNTPSVGEIVDAMEVLTDKERSVMEFIPTLNEKVLMPAINEVTNEFFGFDLATDPSYWGLKRRIIRGVRGRIIGGPAIEDLGAFQEFLGSKIQLRISPFWDQLVTQIQNASSLHGMAVPMENARSMLNDKSWQESMDAAGRKKEKDNLIKIFERTQGIASDKDSFDIIGSTFLNRSAKAILGWRVSTVANQTASIPMAFTVIPDKYIGPLSGLKVQRGSEQSNRINEFSSFLRMRELGGRTGIITGDAGVSHSVDNLIFRQKTDLSMEGMRRADRFAIETIDIAVQRWIADTTKLKVGGKKYWQAVARRSEEVVRKTQPMWDVDERSILGSTPSAITRSFFIFRSAREAVLNQNLMAVDRVIKADDKSQAVKQLANTLGATTLSTAMVVGIRTAMWTATGAIFAAITGRDPPDEDKTLKEKVGDAAIDMLKNTVEYAPLGRVVIGVAKMAARKRVFDELHPDSILFGGVASVGKSLGHMNAAYGAYFVDGDKDKLQLELLSAANDAADAIGRLKGIPTGGILQLTTQPLERALRQKSEKKRLTLPD